MKRASIEPNFHQVYIGFIDALSMPDFTKEVLHETYRNIKVKKTVQTFINNNNTSKNNNNTNNNNNNIK